MADEDDHVIVKIEGEPANGAETTTEKVAANGHDTTAATTAIPDDDLATQFEELKARSEQDRIAADRRASLAEQDADRARKEVATARGEVLQSRTATVEAGISAAEAEVATAKREIKIAGESGDFERQTEAYDRLATARADLAILKGSKSDLEASTIEPERVADRRADPTPQQRPADPVEQVVAAMSAKSAAWVRAHPDYVTDPKKYAKMLAAHHDAQAEGIVADTPAYFSHIEQFTGITKPPASTERQPQTRQRRPSVPAAPVSNSGGGTNGGGDEVRLSRNEATAATDGTHVWNYDDTSGKNRFKRGDPIGVQEFARRKREMTREGRYDRMQAES